jgi:hypothetical protein
VAFAALRLCGLVNTRVQGRFEEGFERTEATICCAVTLGVVQLTYRALHVRDGLPLQAPEADIPTRRRWEFNNAGFMGHACAAALLQG